MLSVSPQCDVLAIDLDGTLLNRDHQVTQRNIDAINRARDAGVTVLVCTGRGLGESIGAMRAIDQRDPVMVAGGSIIADPVSGQTLHRFPLDHAIVQSASELFHEVGCPALVMKDPSEIEYDYLVLNAEDGHPIHPITTWWFDDHQLRVNYAPRAGDDPHPQHSVRVGMCAEGSISTPISRKLLDMLGDQVWLYDFPCVMPEGHSGEVVHILELFASNINKWSAIGWYLQKHGIDPERVVAIGDQVNDLPMIEGCGVGIAMGNAISRVKASARYTTADNEHDGVAVAIEALLSDRLGSLDDGG